MKKVLVLFLIFLMTVTAAFASGSSTELYRITDKLNVAYHYQKDLYYRFIFSDVKNEKSGNFQDLFENSNIEWITMSKLENGVLKNDKPLYVHWMVDEMTPISKLTIDIPGPLVNETGETLDWYVSIDGRSTMGGKAGYGDINAATIYERDVTKPLIESTDSVQLNLWTDPVKGKTAGKYVGTIVLNVYGEI